MGLVTLFCVDQFYMRLYFMLHLLQKNKKQNKSTDVILKIIFRYNI